MNNPDACTGFSISGSTRRLFTFSASPADTFAFYRDIGRSLGFLPHITVVQKFTLDQYRLVYRAKESAMLQVSIFCDVLAEADAQQRCIRILPLPGMAPVQSKVRLNEIICHGYYTSEIVFNELGDQTQADISLEIQAELPKPPALRWLPHALLSGAAQNIFLLRLDEVINGFIDQSRLAYSGGGNKKP